VASGHFFEQRPAFYAQLITAIATNSDKNDFFCFLEIIMVVLFYGKFAHIDL
jgi:hypothetical protein